MDDADSTEESADDMTAAETPPKPKKLTALGVKYWRTADRQAGLR